MVRRLIKNRYNANSSANQKATTFSLTTRSRLTTIDRNRKIVVRRLAWQKPPLSRQTTASKQSPRPWPQQLHGFHSSNE